jgi:CRISPR-associated protein Cas5d
MRQNNSPHIRLQISGDFACFTRPENKVERVSYEAPTPSAARNILDSICFRPEMRWVVTRILVLKPIRWQSFRRNEVQSKLSPASVKRWMKDSSSFQPQVAGAGNGTDATPRTSLILRDVAYVIEAYPFVFDPDVENTPTKYMAMFNRRVKKGQCFQQPYLGCREFAVSRFELATASDQPLREVNVDIGIMLYDILFREESNRAIFFRASIQDGVLDTHPQRAIPDIITREALLTCSFRR